MRPDKDTYLMRMAATASQRATCDRLHVGCVIATPEGHIQVTGYNGSAPKTPHCDDVGHYMVDGHCIRTVHAERNALDQAARLGKATNGCYAYVTAMPCTKCLQDLISSGITRVYVGAEYWNSGTDHAQALGLYDQVEIFVLPVGWDGSTPGQTNP